MRGGNHGKIRIECSVDPDIVTLLMMLKASYEDGDAVYKDRLRRYVAEMIETYVPALFQHRFGISIAEFKRRFPAPVVKQIPDIVRELLQEEHESGPLPDWVLSSPV